MKEIFRFTIILGVVSPVIFFLHTGFIIRFDSLTFQAMLFSLVFSLAIVRPLIRKYVFILSVALIFAVAPFFILNIMDWANILGSTGMGFVLLLVLTYLPDFIKKGFLEKL